MSNSKLENTIKKALIIGGAFLATAIYAPNVNAQYNPDKPPQNLGCKECEEEKKKEEPKKEFKKPNYNNNKPKTPQKDKDTVFVPLVIRDTTYITAPSKDTNSKIENKIIIINNYNSVDTTKTKKKEETLEKKVEDKPREISINTNNYIGLFGEQTNYGVIPGIHYGRNVTKISGMPLEVGAMVAAGYFKNNTEENSPVGSTKTSTLLIQPGVYTNLNINETFGVGLEAFMNLAGDQVREELYNPKTKNLIKEKDHDTKWYNEFGGGINAKAKIYGNTEFRVGIKAAGKKVHYNAGVSLRF